MSWPSGTAARSPSTAHEAFARHLYVFWLVSAPARLSELARVWLRDPSNEVFLSVVSAWEIAIKHGNGQLALPVPPHEYVPMRRQEYGLASLPLDEEAALHIGRLPLLHRDPFDRALVGQAAMHGLTILTPDAHIAQYGVHTRW